MRNEPMNQQQQMIDPADVQKVVDRHSWADEDTDCKSVLNDVLRDLRSLLPKPDYPEDMLGRWAEHQKYGRVLVCSAKPDEDGQVGIALRDEDGSYMAWVDPSRLSFPEPYLPEPHFPETLTTLEDYENAQVGTIAAISGCAPIIKMAGGDWSDCVACTIAPKGVTRQVLRWGWGE